MNCRQCGNEDLESDSPRDFVTIYYCERCNYYFDVINCELPFIEPNEDGY